MDEKSKLEFEPIELLALVFFEMAAIDGKIVLKETETILEMVADLLEYDKNNMLSKSSSKDSVAIVNGSLKFYAKLAKESEDSRMSFFAKVIDMLNNEFSDEDKKLVINMLVSLAKCDGEVQEAEVSFFNFIKTKFGF